eukprot:8783493-Pyramimonas_sp.AAC.2
MWPCWGRLGALLESWAPRAVLSLGLGALFWAVLGASWEPLGPSRASGLSPSPLGQSWGSLGTP